MSFIGDLLKAQIEVDGECVRMSNKLALSYETATGAASAVALDVKNIISFLVTNATGGAYTLADGTYVGQVKIVSLKTKVTNDAVLTPATFGPGNTLTLGTVGEGAILIWDGTSWQLVSNYGGVVA